MLSRIGRSGLQHAEIAHTFLHELRATSQRLDPDTPFSIQNAYAYNGPEYQEEATAANEVILGAIALATNVPLASPNRFADHVREEDEEAAFYDGVVFATQFLPQDKAITILKEHLPS